MYNRNQNIISHILQTPIEPKSRNVLWDDGEAIKIWRKEGWTSIGSGGIGGKIYLKDLEDVELIKDDISDGALFTYNADESSWRAVARNSLLQDLGWKLENNILTTTHTTHVNSDLIVQGDVSSGGEGSSNPSGGATYLNDLLDVEVTNAISGNILQYDGTNWVPIPFSSIEIDKYLLKTDADNYYASKSIETWVNSVKNYITYDSENNAIICNTNLIVSSDVSSGGTGQDTPSGGGSDVSFIQTQTSGTKIGTLTIDGVSTELFVGKTLGNASEKDVADRTSASTLFNSTNLVTERTVYYGLARINGQTQTRNLSIYAPTTCGDTGLFLTSTGMYPIWTTIDKNTVGLGNVDNTADANKSVNYANSAGNAAQLGEKSSSLYVSSQFTPNGNFNEDISSGIYRYQATLANGPTNSTAYGNLLVVRHELADTLWQMYGNYTDNKLFYRAGSTSTSNPITSKSWKEIAFLDSTVSKASQLANTRKIWGKDFNGTSDVDGTLIVTPASSNYTEGIRVKPFGGWSICMLLGIDNTANAGTSANTWGMMNNNGNFYINRAGSQEHTGYELCCVGGNWGIATNDPKYKWHVEGSSYINGNLIVSGDASSGSDIRFKDVIENKTIRIDDIANAPLFSFKWNDRDDDSIHLGTSAQYWEERVPEIVSGSDFKTLNYASLGVAMGISLAKQSINHEERIKMLEDEVKVLNQEINRLRNGQIC